MANKSHPVYSKDSIVFLETGEYKLEVMNNIIDKSGFLKNINQYLENSGKLKKEFLVAIKPNIMTASVHEDPSPVYTDPELVEHLINRLRGEGFTNIAVVEARNVYDYSYQGRSVQDVAELAGYSGSGYSIIELTAEPEPHNYGGVLGEHSVGRTWKNADYRISFAKNKTHWQCYYTGCLKNVYGCLPEWDKMKHYHGKGREFFECCILILDSFPVHFGFLDAWVSGDGFSGHVRDAKPNYTGTIFASENIYALDWVMGEKMNVDPLKNSVIKEAEKYWGSIDITRYGDMIPWPNWNNVNAFTIFGLDIVEEAYWISRFFSRSFASHQDKRFPPVKKGQWFYGSIQAVVRFFEKLFK